MLKDQFFPDLVIDTCPQGCSKCARIYINSTIGHKIICNCSCGHRKTGRELEQNKGISVSNSLIKQSTNKSQVKTATPIESDDGSACHPGLLRRLRYD